MARVKVHLEFCSRPINLTPKSLFPKSGQYRTFLSQPGSGRLIRLAKGIENTIRYYTILDDADSANRINFAASQRDLHDQGHPMNLFLKIFVLQANFCWLGDLEKKCISLKGMLLENRQLRVSKGI